MKWKQIKDIIQKLRMLRGRHLHIHTAVCLVDQDHQSVYWPPIHLLSAGKKISNLIN
jgi:predicted house-cleaning NTP pyrophosphatase (Maf/HAM1 superfamily)